MDMNSVLDLKPFLPAKDYALAKQFYLDLGFTMMGRQLHDASIGQGCGRMVEAHTRHQTR
jgi:hypothetical protein